MKSCNIFNNLRLKHPYEGSNGQSDVMESALSLTFYPTLVSTIIGFIVVSFQK